MNPTAKIIPATAADLPAVRSLAQIIWRAAYPGIITPQQIEYMLDWMYSVEQLRADLDAGITYDRLFVGERFVAFAAYGADEKALPAGPICKLHKLYLLPECHGQGWGSYLLQHVIATAKAGGYAILTLNVNKNNTPAIRAYQRNGFAIAASVANDIGGGFVMDDYVMELLLVK